VDYNALARGIEASDELFAIAESQSFNSYMEKKAFAYRTGTPKEVAKCFPLKMIGENLQKRTEKRNYR